MASQKIPTTARHIPTNVRNTLRQDFIKQRKEAQRKENEAQTPSTPTESAESKDAAQIQGQGQIQQSPKLRKEGPVQEVRREDVPKGQSTADSEQGPLGALNSFVAPLQDRARSFFSNLRETLFGGRNQSVEKADVDSATQGASANPTLQEIQSKDPWGTRTNGLGAAVHREAAGVSMTQQARPRPLRDAGIFADRLLDAEAAELPRIGLSESAPSEVRQAQTVERKAPRVAAERTTQEPRTVFSQQVSSVAESAPIDSKVGEPIWGDDLPRVGF